MPADQGVQDRALVALAEFQAGLLPGQGEGEQGRRVAGADFFVRQSAHGGGGERHEIRLMDAPLKTIGQSSDHWEIPRSALPSAKLQSAVKMEAAHHQEAVVKAVGENADHGHKEERAEAARAHRQSCREGRIAEEFLEEQRQQRD